MLNLIWKNNIKKMAMSIVGFLILALSISLIIKLNVGKSLYNIISLGLVDILKINNVTITIGLAIFFVDLTVALIGVGLFRLKGEKRKLWGPIAVGLFLGSFVDFWNLILNIPDLTTIIPFWGRALLIIPAIIIGSFGVALTIVSHIMIGALDILCLVVAKITNTLYGMARTYTQLFAGLIGFLMMTYTNDYSHLTAISILTALTYGRFVQFWLGPAEKIYDWVMNI